MSVKKHYQKRNQELNKDLMKRWGYAPPEEPIDEGVFDDLGKRLQGGSIGRKQQQLDDLGGDPDFDINKYLNRDSTSDGTKDTSDVADVEEKADDIIDSLEDKEKKLTAFANQTAALLIASGISQQDKIYKDIVKSMKDAIKALERTDSEVKKAMTDDEIADDFLKQMKQKTAGTPGSNPLDPSAFLN